MDTASSSTSHTYFAEQPFAILCGDALTTINGLQGIKVDTVITSPPYYKQRSYGNNTALEIGREESVDIYVSSLVTILSAIPLNRWGSIWINIGDKRAHGELLCVPERFIIAMQDAGFHLIDKVIWAKEAVDLDGNASGHCMIEPANGRLNGNGWEPFYRFVIDPKQAWSDTCAVRIPVIT
jgi:site-specific DNA-methyltransferase (adenine-specific)